MSYSSMFGSHFMPGRVWRPRTEVTQDNVGMVPPEELIVDPYLPAVGTDPFDPAGVIVIPSGRFVSIGYTGGRGSSSYRFLRTDSGKTTLTLHDGKNLTPVGMSINQMFRYSGEFMDDSNTTKFKQRYVAEVPFVLNINNAHGTLAAGDNVTGYWGSTTSTTAISYLHRGKAVKWYPLTTYTTPACTNSAVQNLPAAIYPGITPTLIATFGSGGALVQTVTGTVAHNGSSWQVTYAGAGSGLPSMVMYSYGQAADQIGGEVMRIQSITDILTRDDYLKWVEYSPSDYLNYPPAYEAYPVTSVGTGSDPTVNSDWETPSTVTANVSYRTANANLSVRHPVMIAVQGTFSDINGVTQTYTGNASSSVNWFVLPTASIPDARGYFDGPYHDINWRTGVITLSSNFSSVTGIKVLYSYLTDPRLGAAAWGAGIINLTDGRNLGANKQGVPSNLNLADVIAAMRIIVK